MGRISRCMTLRMRSAVDLQLSWLSRRLGKSQNDVTAKAISRYYICERKNLDGENEVRAKHGLPPLEY